MDTRFPPLLLASASPRRIELLQEAGFSPEVRPSSYAEILPELPAGPLTAAEQAMFFALGKALDVRDRLAEETKEDAAERVIIGADTIVVYEGRSMGKPKDKEDGMRMLLPLSGRTHQVITGVCLSCGPRSVCFYDSSTVQFKPYGRKELAAYLDTEEPYDKAGGYAIQGSFSKYIDGLAGSRSNVIGFPLERFREELQKLISNSSK